MANYNIFRSLSPSATLRRTVVEVLVLSVVEVWLVFKDNCFHALRLRSGYGKCDAKYPERSRRALCNVQASIILAIFLMILNNSTCNAAPILDELKKRSVDAESVTGDFIQHKIIKGLSIPLISKGVFSYKKEDKLVWQIKTPIENTYSIEYDQITKKSSVENMVEGLDAPADHYQKIITMFLDLFSGNWDVLEKYFSIDGESDANGWKAVLTPKDQLFQTMFLSLTLKGDKYIHFMQIDEKNGDTTKIEFKQIKAIAASDPKSSLDTEEE